MIEVLAGILIILSIINIILLFIFRKSSNNGNAAEVIEKMQIYEKVLDKQQSDIKDEFARNREESSRLAKEMREEVSKQFTNLSEYLYKTLDSNAKNTLQNLSEVKQTVENNLKELRTDNEKKLEQMRETVDEKLSKTLEERLGQSFKLVSERLEKVHQGLGEMQKLATGVGDLKKVLSNVKTKGVLGEYQLENILEQILTHDQYGKNVKTKSGSNAIVEFAVKLPGRRDNDKEVWLPIDSKFPTEDYQRLREAYEISDIAMIEESKKQLALRVESCAKDISEKYIDPPNTTDFAVMFLPIEGLYAEILNQSGLFEKILTKYHINITGPTTLSALLSSLQMGFRTLAIEKRSSEVWNLLGAIKTEFGRFGDILAKTQKKLNEASNVIDQAGRKTRTIERKLRDVQTLPENQVTAYLGDGYSVNTVDEEV